MSTEGAAGATGSEPGTDTNAQQQADTQQQATGAEQTASQSPGGEAGKDAPKAFAELDEATRAWLEKRNVTDGTAAAKLAYAQDKLLGSAIRIPGKDATDEERAAYLNKLGRPDAPEGYQFALPQDFPKDVPYDDKRAADFRQLAHKVGLTAEQAQAVHDWAATNAAADFTSAGEAEGAALQKRADTAKAQLEALWGPLDGPAAKANLEFADRAFKSLATPEFVEELRGLKLLGAEKEVFSAPFAATMAKIGMAMFGEDTAEIRVDVAHMRNPFAVDTFSLTEIMRVAKQDPGMALSLCTAAGKNPADYGLDKLK